uniref:hypothetical protein n=1 Tax=Trichocoleus desertorum TaxID=1481672 RepID=UPI0025B41FBD|nr:hypothetical protein [Trichocoleus desertorum]
MKNKAQQPLTWKFSSLQYGHELKTSLQAYWEVFDDPITDSYEPDEMSAIELFELWAKRIQEKYPNGLIPILWQVEIPERMLEFMPFQYEHAELEGIIRNNDFLTHFTQPINAVTGELLNWLRLPVVDKLWNSEQADKGGFIQEATGWKPSILQPYVYLPTLTEALVRS